MFKFFSKNFKKPINRKKSKSIEIPELGTVTLKKHKQARYLKIKVDQETNVSVMMPHYIRYDTAVEFLQEKIDWVKNERNKFAAMFPKNPDAEIIEKELRKKAKKYLPGRVAELASIHRLNYNKVRIKNTRSRWGSCSSENNINLCIHLMRLPQELIDYVILHELAHTIEKNHSERFWSLLSSLLNADAKIIDRQMKKYKTYL